MYRPFVSGIYATLSLLLGIVLFYIVHAVVFRGVGSMAIIRVAGTCFGYGIPGTAKGCLAAVAARG